MNFAAVMFSFCFSLLSGFAAHGEVVSAEMGMKESARHVSSYLGFGYTRLAFSSGSSINAVVANGGVVYGLSRSFGVDLGLAQGFSTSSGFSSVFISGSLQFVWAVTGSVLLEKSTTTLNQTEVLSSTERQRPSLKLQFGLSDYVITGSASTVTFAGYGAKIRYELPSSSQTLRYFIDIGADQLSNGVTTATPIKATGGVLIWL